MKKILIGLGVVVVLAIIIIAATKRSKVSGEGIYAEKVSQGDVITTVTGTGDIQPRTKVNISSEVYGQIVALPVKEGETIAKGQLLVAIDPEKYQTEVDRLSANVRVSRTAIESEEVNLANLELDQRRAHQLFDQSIVSSAEREKSDLAVDSSRIRLRSLREEVTQAEASLGRATNDISKTKIYAPMSGKVTQVNTEIGEQVIVGTTNIPGSVMMVISDMSEILAEVKVDETEIVKLRPEQSAEVTADAVEKVTYKGRVTEIGNTAVKQGDVNVFEVKILLANPDERLRPGMTAKAKIEVDRQENTMRVPIQAVTARERRKLEADKKAAGSAAKLAAGSAAKPAAGDATAAKSDAAAPAAKADTPNAEKASLQDPKPATKPGDEREEIDVVYVIDGVTVTPVQVKTGASDETYVEIKEGLKEGQMVVKGPYRVLRRLKEGDRIVVKDERESEDEGGSGSGESSSKGD